MNEPLKIPVGFATSGDKNTIPETTVTPGAASWAAGFPSITSVPVTQGGVAPTRADFNGIFNALSLGLMWIQQGNHYSYDDSINYNPGALVSEDGALYFCKQANGPDSTVVAPGTDASVWGLLLNAEGNSTINTTGRAGNASVATKALQDGTGNVIADTYLTIDGAAAEYATKADDSAKLPLSGGTMTGAIALPSTGFQITNSSDTGRIVISGGTDTTSPYIRLSSKSETTPYIQLVTPDSVDPTALHSFSFLPNGNVLFDNKQVECAVEKGIGYLKFSDGTQICWGDFNISSTTSYSATFNYPRAFVSVPNVVFGGVGGGDVIANTNGRTNTSCTVTIKNAQGTYAWNKFASYIAIGTGA